MVAKKRNIIVVLGVFLIAVLFLNSEALVRVEASEIDIYTSSEESNKENKKTAVVETTVANSDATITTTVEMMETYNEDYGLYEEAIGNEFFIYANVGNGNISSNPVTIDIPDNVNYTMEKDGKEINYSSGSKIKGKGNYVLRVTAISKTMTYQSTFRFSIRNAAEKKNEKEMIEKEAEVVEKAEELTEHEAKTSEEKTSEEKTSEAKASEAKTSEAKTSDALEEDSSASIDESSPRAVEESVKDASKYTKFLEEYEEATGDYVNTLFSGEVFRANLPNGIITNSKVFLSIPDTIDYIVYKDDELYETTSLQFTEAGSYRIVMSCESLDYILAYGDDTKVTYSFRMIGDAVSDIHIFNTPAGFTLTEVYFENNEVFAANHMQGSYFKLTEDGNYVFNYTKAETGLTYSTSLELDTKAPEASIYIKNGVASITYISTDIESIELLKNNVAVTEFSERKISGKGFYTLTVTDHASNKNTAYFQLKDSVNSATIWSLIILAAIISGVFWIVRFNQRKIVVR